MILRVFDWNKNFETPESRKLKFLKWVAVPNKTDGEGYTALIDHENGPSHLGAWYAIVETASRQDPRGTLPRGIPADFTGICRSLGRISRLPSRIFEEAIPRLIEIGWIECIHEDTEISVNLRENPAIPAAHNRNKTVQDKTEHDKNQKHVADATFALSPPENPPSSVRSVVPAGPTFDDWWKVWWNKTAKADAQKAWKAISTQFGAQFLIDACVADRQRFEGTPSWDWRANLHPATWLRGARWEDQLPPSSNGKVSGKQSRTDAIEEALKDL